MSKTNPTRRVASASHETLIALLETLPDAFFFIDDAATIVYANVKAQAMLGATREEVCGQSLWRGAPYLVSTSLYQAVQKTKQTREPLEVEYVSPVTRTWLHVQLSPGVGGLLLYVHERREPLSRREAFVPDEPFTADVLKNLYVGVGYLTPEGILLEINEAPLDDAQIRREEVIGYPFAETPWWTFYPASQEQLCAAIMRASAGETVRFETLVHPREGMDLHLEATITPHRDVDHHVEYLVYVGTDITERKRAEEALRQSQERVSALMNSSLIGIFVTEEDQIVEANETYLRMTGYTQEDLRAGRINWVHMTPPEYIASTQQARQELAVLHHVTRYDKDYICKDGSHLPVVVGAVALHLDPLQAIGFVLDNSAHKELEQRKDAFLSMASHELKTPLTALKLQTSLLQRQLAKQGIPASAPALSRMETQINKVTRLVDELLDVSKIQAGRLEYLQEAVDLDALLQEITTTMQQAYPSHRIVVRGRVGASLIGDQDRLGQVFTNLISNAIKYSPDAEVIEMDLCASEDAATISIHDHGLGIPQAQRDKIFERFYRASGPMQKGIPGLGIGLSIVAEIVKRHGGTITVESTVGKGSTFTVTLPAHPMPEQREIFA